MSKNIGVVIVEKTGVLKNLCIKSFSEDDLYKKSAVSSQKKTLISITNGVLERQI